MTARLSEHGRYLLLLLLIFGSLAGMLSLEPLAQSSGYHDFADKRPLLGIPHCVDVLSNLPFLLVGGKGWLWLRRARLGAAGAAWQVLFVGMVLVSVGSAFYHWHPDNDSLVWDRLPMTVGFMGLLIALLGEYVQPRLVGLLLLPALLLGLASVLYWHWFDDLRLYYWVQLIPLLSIPVLMLLFRSRYSHQWLLPVALGWYLLAKVAEANDLVIFQLSGELLSGHSLKHLLAAGGCYSLLLMLKTRKPIAGRC